MVACSLNERTDGANAGPERIKGYPAKAIIGEHFSGFYTDEEVRAGKPDHELTAARTFDDGE